MSRPVTRPDVSLASGEFWGRNPHAELTWLRQHDPVHWDELGEVWGITRYHHIKEVSRNPELFSSAGGIRPDAGAMPMMIDMDDPMHWARRKLLNKGFTPRRVADQADRIGQIADALIDRVCERGSCDFVWDVAAWLPLIVIGDALGASPAQHGDLLRWSDDIMRGLGAEDPAVFERTTAAFGEYSAYIADVIAHRRQAPTEDLIGILVHAELDGDRLDDESLLFESILLLIGGDETTRHVITGGLYQLLTHRDQWERLRADRELMAPAVEEMLRWVTPIKNMARTVTADTDFHGTRLREGQKVLLLYPSGNRDEEVFDDPFTFDITRSPNDHIAFGLGTHFCLGNSLARLELRTIFDRLLDRLPDLRLAEPAEPAYRPANFVSGYETLPVTFTPTAPVGATL